MKFVSIAVVEEKFEGRWKTICVTYRLLISPSTSKKLPCVLCADRRFSFIFQGGSDMTEMAVFRVKINSIY